LVLPLESPEATDSPISAIAAPPEPAIAEVRAPAPPAAAKGDAQPEDAPANPFDDDRDNLEPSDRTLLVIEDDPDFAGALMRRIRKKASRSWPLPAADRAWSLPAAICRPASSSIWGCPT
jgi:hypothetical protein